MNCSRCGTPLPDDATFCPNCAFQDSQPPPAPPLGGYAPQNGYGPQGGYPPPQGGYAPHGGYGPSLNIPDYLVWSIITTLCCQPFGIAAIVFSVMTMNDKTNGNIDSAMKNSKMAKTMITFGLVGWGLIVLCYIAFIAVIIAVEHSH